MKYKAVVYDIDGTIAPPLCCSVSPAVKQAALCLRKAGAVNIIASGRTPNLASPAVLGGFPADYVIGVNGGSAVAADGTLVFEHPFTEKQTRQLIEFADLTDAEFAFSFTDGYFAYNRPEEAISNYTLKDYGGKPMLVDPTRTRHLAHSAVGAILRTAPENAAKFEKQFYAQFDDLRLVQIFLGSYDVCPVNGSKAHGIEQLLGTLGISPCQTAAIGDGYNDIEMVKSAGLGIAMGNACQALKDAADAVTLDFEHDGVAYAIEKFILEAE